MKHIKPLSQLSMITLQEMYQYAPIHRLRQRAHILLLSNKRLSLDEISYVADLDRETGSLTLDNWDKKGLGGLYDKHRCGRRTIYSEQEQSLIVAKLEQEPRQMKKVRADIAQQTGKTSSIDTLKRVVKRHGMVWKRLKKGLAGQPDPVDYTLKKQPLDALNKSPT